MLTWGQESLGKDLRVHVDEALSYNYRSEENRVKSEIVVQLLWMGGAAGSVRIGNGRSTIESRFRPRAAAGVQLLPPSLQSSLASESSSTTHAWPVHEAIPESQEVSSSVTRGIGECILLTINMLIIMKQVIVLFIVLVARLKPPFKLCLINSTILSSISDSPKNCQFSAHNKSELR